MQKVAIIGCGYVGLAVARRWHPIFQVTTTTTRAERVPDLESVSHQVCVLQGSDESGLRSLLQDQQVVLLSVGARRADAYESTYLGTAKALVTALQDAPSVQQVIYTSSYAVYGDRGGQWVDETTPVAPANRNGEILAETEQVLLGAASDRRRICVFRLGGIYGPGRELIKIFRGVAGTTRPGNGTDAANWIHLADIVGAIDFARQHQLDGIFNLVCDRPLTTKDLLDQICTAYGLPPVSWDPSQASLRPYNARVSNQKVRSVGYSFLYPEIVATTPA